MFRPLWIGVPIAKRCADTACTSTVSRHENMYCDLCNVLEEVLEELDRMGFANDAQKS